MCTLVYEERTSRGQKDSTLYIFLCYVMYCKIKRMRRS